jgi:hypothetical protein
MNFKVEKWGEDWIVLDRDRDPYDADGEFDGYKPVVRGCKTEAEAKRWARIYELRRNIGLLRPPRS